MAKWKYKIVKEKIYDEKYLNSLGDEGWKLCGVVITPLGEPILYFVREVFVCYSGPQD